MRRFLMVLVLCLYSGSASAQVLPRLPRVTLEKAVLSEDAKHIQLSLRASNPQFVPLSITMSLKVCMAKALVCEVVSPVLVRLKAVEERTWGMQIPVPSNMPGPLVVQGSLHAPENPELTFDGISPRAVSRHVHAPTTLKPLRCLFKQDGTWTCPTNEKVRIRLCRTEKAARCVVLFQGGGQEMPRLVAPLHWDSDHGYLLRTDAAGTSVDLVHIQPKTRMLTP